jgi:hypothetical protein
LRASPSALESRAITRDRGSCLEDKATGRIARTRDVAAIVSVNLHRISLFSPCF